MLVNHALLKNRVDSASSDIKGLGDPETILIFIRTWFRVTDQGFLRDHHPFVMTIYRISLAMSSLCVTAYAPHHLSLRRCEKNSRSAVPEQKS